MNELFLWQTEQEHFLLTPYTYLAISLSEQNLPTAIGENYPATQIFSEEVITALTKACQVNTTLYLHKSVADNWQALAWEKLSLKGQSLGEHLHIVRYAQFDTVLSSPKTKWLILNHWEDPCFFSSHLQAENVEIKTGKKINLTLQQTDLSRYQGLIIIAHGSEELEASPLLTSSGDKWDLQLPHSLPQQVLIIACASKQSHFATLIKTCLKQGSISVIAPNGKLDATAMQDFLKNSLQNPNCNTVTYLKQQQDTSSLVGGVRCLQQYGALNPINPPELKDYRQLSIDYYYHQQDIVQMLRDKHRIGEEKTAQQWLTSTLACFEKLPVTTQSLLIDYVDYLAESWASDRSRCIRQWRKLLQKYACYAEYNNTFKYFVQARTARRKGKYVTACQFWMQAYQTQNQEDTAILTPLYGLLLNILIDLNLPQVARSISDQLERCLHNNSSEQSDEDAIKFFDRRARVLMREANYTQAIQAYQYKARELGGSATIRELSTLVYAQVWSEPTMKETQDNIERLRTQLPANARFDKDYSYALRALFLAAWRTQHSNLKDTLQVHADEMLPIMSSNQDRGAAAMSLFFAHFAGIKGFTDTKHLEKAIGALETDSYWFELALLLSINQQTKKARQYLTKYQQIRDDSLGELTEFWHKKGISLDDELLIRKQEEVDLIQSFDFTLMLKKGLIPL